MSRRSLWNPPPCRQYLLMREQSMTQKREILWLMRQHVWQMVAERVQAQPKAAWQHYKEN